MMLLECDAKALLAARGIHVPRGVLVRSAGELPTDLGFPVMVKAQVPVGGRGKAGGVARAADAAELAQAIARITAATIKGHRVRECLVEEMVTGHECFIGLALDASRADVNVLISAHGGVEVEAAADRMLSAHAAFDRAAVTETALGLARQAPAVARAALTEAAPRLADAFFALEAMLVEINPLFVRPDGSWVAGDAKIVVDENALARQGELAALVRDRAAAYPEAAGKLESGFDFAILDSEG